MTGTLYCSVVELRQEIGKTLTKDDTVLEKIIEAASDEINRILGWKDGFQAGEATARAFPGKGDPYLYIDPCISITLVEVKDSATDTAYVPWATADWIAASGSPSYPDYNVLPYQLIMVNPAGTYGAFTDGKFYSGRPKAKPVTVQTVRVTARWGYSATPPAVIRQACLAQASRWFKRGQGGWSDALANENTGQMIFAKEFDPDIKGMLMKTALYRPTLARR